MNTPQAVQTKATAEPSLQRLQRGLVELHRAASTRLTVVHAVGDLRFEFAGQAAPSGGVSGRAITTATTASPKSACGTLITALSPTPGMSFRSPSISAG
jgi:hypothetical protein